MFLHCVTPKWIVCHGIILQNDIFLETMIQIFSTVGQYFQILNVKKNLYEIEISIVSV